MVTKNHVTYQNNQWTSHENKEVEPNAIQINIYQSQLTKFRRGAKVSREVASDEPGSS